MESRSIFSPPRSMPPNDMMSPTKEPPACVQNAMFTKDKKPFTYTPGGIDLSQIRSEKMAKRLMRNAMSPGVQERPKAPNFQSSEPPTPTPTTPNKSCQFYNLPVAVFPTIVIPPNPKELLRRTSGPHCRSASVEKSTPPAFERQASPPETKINGDVISNLVIEKQMNGETPKMVSLDKTESDRNESVSKSIYENGDVKNVPKKEDKLVPSVPKDNKVIRETLVISPVEAKSDGDVVEAKLVLPIENISQLAKLELNRSSDALSNRPKKDDHPMVNGFLDEKPRENNILTIPLVDALIGEDKISTHVTDVAENCQQQQVVRKADDEPNDIHPRIEDVPNECENIPVKIEDNERVISPMRRSTDGIRGLSEDLDSLPTLNICTKRFSFLRDTPPREEDNKVEEIDDPFKFLTGIPPKISLIDKKDEYQKSFAPQPPWKVEKEKSPASIPIKEKSPKPEPKLDKLAPKPQNELRAPSPFTLEDDFWTKDWNETPSKGRLILKDILEKDPEPAWKKEIREIALRKAEAKTESKDYSTNISSVSPEKDIKTSATNYAPPWMPNSDFYQPREKPAFNPPTWSQTLRPKSWKEREAEKNKVTQFEPPVWSSIGPKKTLTDRFMKNNSEDSSGTSSPVRKTPEITVEVVNQPNFPAPLASNNNNAYIYPWESSSESSVAFSPEPRTPTPHSRNSPYTLSPNYSGNGVYTHTVGPREYGTLSFQPRRRLSSRSCPIQSRSFKYLQLLTGTDDSYEDDEPFIPQPPQHAYPRPGNF